MIESYDDLTPGALGPLGFEDSARACHILRELAGHDVPDGVFNAMLRVVVNALRDCPDPDRAVANLGRWADVSGSRLASYQLLSGSPAAAEMLLTVFATSQFFSNLLINNPEYTEILTNPRIRDREREPEALWADLSRRVAIAKTPNGKRDALRRFKPPEILRIGIRDILGYADVPATVRAISDFADSSIRMALQICTEELGVINPPFTVIAMGKLGGREVNYSSDIDLIFVHEEAPGFNAIKLAEAVRDALARVTDAGFVFRVDLRLRPEGRFGPVSRTLASCRAYYESWAEPWERQAMLKARVAAGDPALGQSFMTMIDEFVYRSRVEESFIDSIRRNKRRSEDKIARAGEADTNVKEGVGGIRDVEFAVQLMQLLIGGKNPGVRTGNTLEAIAKLTEAGMLMPQESEILSDSYLFLRNVEHRLQIMDELPIRNLPKQPAEMEKFSRRLGCAGSKEFLDIYRARASRVSALFKKLFYGEDDSQNNEISSKKDEISEWIMALDDPEAAAALRGELLRRGIDNPDGVMASLRQNIHGSEYGGIPPDAREAFAAIAGPLLDAIAQTADPSAAIRGLDALAQAVPSRNALYRTLAESPGLLPRLAALAAEGPALWQLLMQRLEFFDLLADDEAIDTPAQRPGKLADTPRALAGQIIRAHLQAGARDIWNLSPTLLQMTEITAIAEFALDAALAIARRDLKFEKQFAIMGMGKLGGAELGYASDLDVLYISETGELASAAKVAKRVQDILKDEIARFGFRYEIDARLRPDGRKGSLVLDIDSYRRYYEESAATWERQALIKAWPAAGSAELGQKFMEMATAAVYGTPITEEQLAEIRAMKTRIEIERLHNPNDLKLAPGGLTDIEWTTQFLQLKHGPTRPRVRHANTLKALLALRDDARITQSDWEILNDAYIALTKLRNRLYLKRGVAVNAPETLPDSLADQMQAVRNVYIRIFLSSKE